MLCGMACLQSIIKKFFYFKCQSPLAMSCIVAIIVGILAA